MNTNTQTVDERCAEMANEAVRQAWITQTRNARNHYTEGAHATRRALANIANRIIALRTAEAAQAERGAL